MPVRRSPFRLAPLVLGQAARQLNPPPSDTRWTQTAEGVRTLQRVVVGCPEG